MHRVIAFLDAVHIANESFVGAIIMSSSAGVGWIKTRWQAAVTVAGILTMTFGAGSGTVLWIREWRVVPQKISAVEARLDTLEAHQALQTQQWERLRCELVEALRGEVPEDCDRRVLR